MWSPDTTGVKSKMMYASTKDFIKQALSGIALELQATDFDELEEGEMRTKVREVLTRK